MTDPREHKTGGEYLRCARAGRSLREVAQGFGFNSGYLSLVEQGRVASPRCDTVARLAKAYGVDAVDLARLFMFPKPRPKPLVDGGHTYS